MPNFTENILEGKSILRNEIYRVMKGISQWVMNDFQWRANNTATISSVYTLQEEGASIDNDTRLSVQAFSNSYIGDTSDSGMQIHVQTRSGEMWSSLSFDRNEGEFDGDRLTTTDLCTTLQLVESFYEQLVNSGDWPYHTEREKTKEDPREKWYEAYMQYDSFSEDYIDNPQDNPNWTSFNEDDEYINPSTALGDIPNPGVAVPIEVIEAWFQANYPTVLEGSLYPTTESQAFKNEVDDLQVTVTYVNEPRWYVSGTLYNADPENTDPVFYSHGYDSLDGALHDPEFMNADNIDLCLAWAFGYYRCSETTKLSDPDVVVAPESEEPEMLLYQHPDATTPNTIGFSTPHLIYSRNSPV